MAQLKARRVKKTYLALVRGTCRRGGRADRGADRPRSEAADADGGRARRAAVDRPAIECASGSPAGRCSSSTSSRGGRTRSGSISRRSAIRSRATRSTARGVAARPGRPRSAVPARLAAGARLARRRAADPRRGAAARPSWRRSSTGSATAGRPRRADGGASTSGRRRADRRLGDPGRPDARGAPGAMLVIISGPSGVGKDTIIARSRRAPHTARDVLFRGHVHDPPAPRGRGRRRRLPLRRPDEVPRAARRRRASSRRTRSTATGTGRRATRSARPCRPAATSILKIDVQGAQVVKEQVPEALLIFVVPPSLEDLFRGCGRGRPRPPRSSRSASATRPSSSPARTTTTTSSPTRPARSSATAERIDEIIAAEHRRTRTGASRLTRRSTLADRRWTRSTTPVEPSLGRRWPRATGGDRLVEVAVDAAGGGGRATYTYAVPDRARRPRGRRGGARRVRAAPGARRRPRAAAPAPAGRDEADPRPGPGRRPLLPPLGLRLARWIADALLAPPAIVIRAMLPPGCSSGSSSSPNGRRRGRGRPTDVDAADARLLDQLAAARGRSGPRGAEGRAGLLRRLRALADAASSTLDWTLSGRGGGPRYERWVRPPTTVGRGRVAPASPAGAPLGPRQAAAARRAARRARGGPARSRARRPPRDRRPWPGSSRRGLVEIEVRERRDGRSAARPVGRRGGRPAGATSRRRRPTRSPRIRAASPTGDRRRSSSTASRAAARPRSTPRRSPRRSAGRPALVLVPEIALALPLVDRLRADLDAGSRSSTPGSATGERADEWRRIRSGRRRHRRRDATRGAGAAGRGRPDRRRRGAREPRTRAIGRRGSRRATRRSRSALAGAAVVLGAARRRSRARPGARRLLPASGSRTAERPAADGRGRRPPGGARRRSPRPARPTAWARSW